MTKAIELTASENIALDSMLSAVIDEARKHGLDFMGIDHPAIDVRESVAAWIVAARKFRPVPTMR